MRRLTILFLQHCRSSDLRPSHLLTKNQACAEFGCDHLHDDCNTQYANCQSSCLAIGSEQQSSPERPQNEC